MAGTELTKLRVGVVDSHDPEDVTLGSGWSSSLTSALSEVVGEVVPVNAQLPGIANRVVYLASVVMRLRAADLRDVRGGAHRVSNSAFLGRPLTSRGGSLHRVVCVRLGACTGSFNAAATCGWQLR